MIEQQIKYPVEFPMSPAIFRTADGTKTYAVGGAAPWILIPNGTKFEDLHLYAIHKKWQPKKPTKKYGVTASNGKRQYIVYMWDNGNTTCDCSGFKWRAKCKHERAVKKLNRNESTSLPSQAVV